MASADEIIADLNRVRASLARAIGAATEATLRLRTVQEQAESLGVRDVIRRFGPVVTMTEQMVVQMSAGLTKVDDAIRIARTARGDAPVRGHGGQPGRSPVRPQPSADADTTETPRPVGERWSRVDDVPQRIVDVGPVRERPAGTNRPTAGFFDGEPVVSGGQDRGIASDLDHDPLRGPPVTFYQHAESKAAARMRQADLRAGEMVIDNTVCGTNEHDQAYEWTCDKILPSILPPGARLTMWVSRDGGRTWWCGTYTGTGERIRP